VAKPYTRRTTTTTASTTSSPILSLPPRPLMPQQPQPDSHSVVSPSLPPHSHDLPAARSAYSLEGLDCCLLTVGCSLLYIRYIRQPRMICPSDDPVK
jgi:hypothetical protein